MDPEGSEEYFETFCPGSPFDGYLQVFYLVRLIALHVEGEGFFFLPNMLIQGSLSLPGGLVLVPTDLQREDQFAGISGSTGAGPEC